MPPLDLDRLEVLERAATPGRWVRGLWSRVRGEWHLMTERSGAGYVSTEHHETLIGGDDDGTILGEADALFLVEGRNAFPDLLRIARVAEALVTGVEREALVPPPLLAALRDALEGRA